jgi:hypothetical protein
MTKCVAVFLLAAVAATAQSRWTDARANQWYASQPWLVGANYIPANAINELEMWQEATFDPRRIDLELGWAESIGMNTMRVFLHDLLWAQDAAGFRKRIDTFLSIAARRHIKPMFVLFDSCWDPNPKLGPQRAPRPGIHNSGWLQSPGAEALRDPAQQRRLEQYVKGAVGAFANDSRVLAWDMWNEPNNKNPVSYGKQEIPDKAELVLAMLPKVFAWSRAAKPSQPLTCGLWKGNWNTDETLSPTEKTQVAESDIISFHNYGPPAEFEKRILLLQRYRRPLLCTEYMARINKSTFEGCLPIAKKHRVAAINWGLVMGKTQTHIPWDSWNKPYIDREPTPWLHEVFRTGGQPYRTEETDVIRQLTGRGVR